MFLFHYKLPSTVLALVKMCRSIVSHPLSFIVHHGTKLCLCEMVIAVYIPNEGVLLCVGGCGYGVQVMTRLAVNTHTANHIIIGIIMRSHVECAICTY